MATAETAEKKDRYEELMKSHPLLFARWKLPMTQTCMCWGCECGPGWYEPLKKMADQLEAINLTTGKEWGFIVRGDQLKQKMGYLHFYNSIEQRPLAIFSVLALPFDVLEKLFWTRHFECKGRVDDGNGKFHFEWRPKFRYAIYSMFHRAANWVRWLATKDGWKQNVIRDTIDVLVNKIVREAENDCYNVCEDCGRQIGTDWSPRCETQGWISYVCEDCAKKHGGVYAKLDGKTVEKRFFRNGEDVTEELKEDRKNEG